MAKYVTVQGTTSNIIHVFVQDATSTSGAGLAGLSFSASGFTMAYIRPGDAAHTLVTKTGSGLNLGTYVSGAWLEVSSGTMPGVYEFHVPNAAVTSGYPRVVFIAQGNAGMAPTPFEIEMYPSTGLFNPILASGTHSGVTIPIVSTVGVVLDGTITFASTAGTVLAGTISFASTAGTVLGGTISYASTAGTVLGGTISYCSTAGLALFVNTCTSVLGGTIDNVTLVDTVTAVLGGTVDNVTLVDTCSVLLDGTVSYASTAGLVSLIATSGIPAVAFRTGAVDAAALNADAATEIANSILDQANGIETGMTLRQSGRVMLSAMAGKLSGAGTTTIAIRDIGDSKDRITATVDATGNRSAVTIDAT